MGVVGRVVNQSRSSTWPLSRPKKPMAMRQPELAKASVLGKVP